MSRKKEFDNFIEEANNYPNELDNLENRLQMKVESNRKRSIIQYFSLSAAACILVFVLLVNVNTAFAKVVSNIPILSEIADFVKLDKGLSTAIENNYIQKLDIVATNGNKRLKLPYVLADEKNIIMFFSMEDIKNEKEGEFSHVSITKLTNLDNKKQIDEYFAEGGGTSLDPTNNNTLLVSKLRLADDIMPRNFIAETTFDDGKGNTYTFEFEIHLKEFAKAKVHEVNKIYEFLDEKIIIEKMIEYPTGTQIIMSYPKENTGFITNLDMSIKEDGKVIGTSNSTLFVEENKQIHYIPANYFSNVKQSLVISGGAIIPKDKLKVTLDVNEHKISPNIEGLKLVSIVKKGELCDITLETLNSNKSKNGLINTHNFLNIGSRTEFSWGENSSKIQKIYDVKIPENGKIELERTGAPIENLDKEIEIEIPRN